MENVIVEGFKLLVVLCSIYYFTSKDTCVAIEVVV